MKRASRPSCGRVLWPKSWVWLLDVGMLVKADANMLKQL
jgi:hypothetical protein